MKMCAVEGCERISSSRGWCRMHYKRWLRNGNTEAQGRRLPTSLGAIAAVDLAWLAGIIEGEGYFGRSEIKKQHKIAVKMTDEDVIRRCKEVAGVGSVTGPYQDARRKTDGTRYKPIWTWGVWARADVDGLMLLLRPLMGERRRARIDELLGADLDG